MSRTRSQEFEDALDLTRSGLQFAYEQGLHEFGVDPVEMFREYDQALRALIATAVDDLAEQNARLADLAEQCDLSHALASRTKRPEDLLALDAAKTMYSVTRGAAIGLKSVVDAFEHFLNDDPTTSAAISEGP